MQDDQRLRKSDRIRKRREYLAIQRQGQKIHLQDIVVLCCRREHGRRLGVTVSKRVGKAVQRNHVKRLIREVWRRNRMGEGFDIVVVARQRAVRTTYGRLTRQLLELARRLRR